MILINLRIILFMNGLVCFLTASRGNDSSEAIKSEPRSAEDRIANWIHETTSHNQKMLKVRPNFEGKPVEISLSITIHNIRDISDAEMTYTIDMFFKEKWIDPRLQYNSSVSERDYLTLYHETLGEMWTPDTFFINAIYTTPATKYSMSHKYGLYVSPNGEVQWSRRLSATLDCHMDLTMYPFDEQLCFIKIQSYMYTVNDVRYKWRTRTENKNQEALFLDSEGRLPNFRLKDHRKYNKNLTHDGRTFSALEACFHFGRNAGFCYMQLLIPAALVVLSSWVSLWLENETQVNDLLTTLLAIIFLSYSYNSMMPRISYVKAMDIYLLACFAFIFLSLGKLIIVKFLKGRAEQREREILETGVHELLVKTLRNDDVNSNEIATSAGLPAHGAHFGHHEIRRRLTRQDIDLIRHNLFRCFRAIQVGSQLILPLLFGGFCVFFFFIYPFTTLKPRCP